MKKADRQKIFDKYGGKCAYCGCELTKGWHVDEIEPVRRKRKYVDGYWADGERETPDRNRETHPDIVFRKFIKGRWVEDGCVNPENYRIENQNPSCASCNINKHSSSIEEFRTMISKFINSLNERDVRYKIAKRYGLIEETNKPVKFYFETL